MTNIIAINKKHYSLFVWHKALLNLYPPASPVIGGAQQSK